MYVSPQGLGGWALLADHRRHVVNDVAHSAQGFARILFQGAALGFAGFCSGHIGGGAHGGTGSDAGDGGGNRFVHKVVPLSSKTKIAWDGAALAGAICWKFGKPNVFSPFPVPALLCPMLFYPFPAAAENTREDLTRLPSFKNKLDYPNDSTNATGFGDLK